MVIVKPEPDSKPGYSEEHKAELEEFNRLQAEYYVNLAEEMKDDCETYKKATECHEYAKLLMYNLPDQAKEGLAQFEFNCAKYRVGASCDEAAQTYLAGTMVERDPEKVVYYWDKACKGDYPQSCIKISKLYQFGRLGVVKDTKKAFEYLTIGCRKNQQSTCAAMGIAHLQGMGVEKDPQKALPILESACERGIAQACHNLGTMYYHGEGVKKDREQAKLYHVKSKIFKGQVMAYDELGRPALPTEPGRRTNQGQL